MSSRFLNFSSSSSVGNHQHPPIDKIPNPAAIDRLSSLHDSVIQHIFSFLPTKESIKTCIVSKRYLHTWASVPVFNLVLDSPNDVDFVDRVLANRSSSCIRTFFIISNQSLGNDRISSWVDYAVAHSVQELVINLNWETELKILDNLYCCQSLESLTLWAVLQQPLQLPDPRTPCFSNLRILKIVLSNLTPGDSIGEVISRCFKLEILLLGGVCFEVLNISAPNLRKLELIITRCVELKVSCPRLEYFVLGLPEKLMNFQGDMPSLTRADIELHAVTSESDLFWRQILKGVNHAARLDLSYVDLKFCPGKLLAESGKHLPTFHNLRILQLNVCLHYGNVEFIVHLLEETPNLEYLMMHIESACICNDKTKQWRARTLPSKVLHNLKALKIFNDTELKICNMDEFVKFLSINVSVWEELVKVI